MMRKKRKKITREELAKEITYGMEVVVTVSVFLYIGYHVCSVYNHIGGILGMVFGAFIGFAIAIYRLHRRAAEYERNRRYRFK